MRHLQGQGLLKIRLSSGWQDSNLRPPHPKCGAIPGYATSRKGMQKYALKSLLQINFKRSLHQLYT